MNEIRKGTKQVLDDPHAFGGFYNGQRILGHPPPKIALNLHDVHKSMEHEFRDMSLQ